MIHRPQKTDHLHQSYFYNTMMSRWSIEVFFLSFFFFARSHKVIITNVLSWIGLFLSLSLSDDKKVDIKQKCFLF